MDKRDFARQLRAQSTDAERLLWFHLRSRRFSGFKFRRQVPLGDYIADFVCCPCRLVVEVDGGQHALQKEYDAARTLWLEQEGFRVLRLPDNVMLKETETALLAIWSALHEHPVG
jgi:very-short-patch-repair endonuclease